MQCEQVRNLFDAYLDGELSSSLATEVNAHCLRCSECGRALALAQVTEYVIAADFEGARLSDDFTERLLACVQAPARRRWLSWRRLAYVGAPLAAAAVVVFAFLGVFEPPTAKMVLGKYVPGEPKPVDNADGALEDEFGRFFDEAEDNWIIKFDSGRLLKGAFDRQMRQVMDLFTPVSLDAPEAEQPTDCDDQPERRDAPSSEPDVEDL